jgi:class 3 adenylate cyclase
MCETPLGKYNKPNNFNQEMNFDQRECRVLNRQLAGVATPGPMTPHFKRVKRTTTMLSEGGSPSTRVRAAASQSSFTARCFVPETLIDYIHNKVHGELKPASFFLKGVCLLVDISGFTKLSGAFCAQGKNGIDGLQLATNGFMGKLVEIIYSFGGDIIKFAGDAIICIFYSKRSLQDVVVKSQTAYSPVSPSHQAMLKIDSNSDKSGGESVIQSRQLSLKHPDNDEDGEETDETEMYTDKGAKYSILTPEEIQPEIVLKAIRCALELRDVETDKLTVHVAMSCGEMCFGILGGYENRWECLISGACIHELSDCLDDAPSKHAALTNQCYQVLNTHSQKKPSAEDNVSGYDYLSQVQLQRLKSGNYMIISADSQDGFGTEYLAETPRSTPLPPLISQFVPVPISAGLEYTTGLSYLAEIREVTTMFMKVRLLSIPTNNLRRILLWFLFPPSSSLVPFPTLY